MPRFLFLSLFSILIIFISEWGDQKSLSAGSKYITVKNIQGKWWLINQDGNPFFSIGMNNILPEDNEAKLGARHYNAMKKFKNLQDWTIETINLLTNIGYNTIGCWSSPLIYNQKILYTIVIEDPQSGLFKLIDIFGPNFEKIIDRAVTRFCLPHKDDPYLMGYFLGNDLFWYGDYAYYTGHNSYLFDRYFDLPASSPGKKKVAEFLQDYYKNISNFNNNWGTNFTEFSQITRTSLYQYTIKDLNTLRVEFLKIVAEHFYSVLHDKIRAVDPSHLIFSDRYANSVPEEVLKIGSKYCDIVSINYYKNLPDIDKKFLAALSFISGKPVIISEFTFRSMDNTSELKNVVGPDTTVSNQQERADHFKKYAMAFAELPFIVGYHWFQFFDEPQDGRVSDGEDSDYGIFDQFDRPYSLLIEAMKNTNPKIESIHSKSKIVIQAENIKFIYKTIVRTGKKNPAFGSIYLDPDTVQNSIVYSWGDTGNGARVEQQKKKNGLEVKFGTGDGWGCGISLLPPNYQKIGYFDASGFKGIKLRMSLPSKLKFIIILNESGADVPWKKDYPGANGADGESYSTDEDFGNSRITEYTYNFEDFNIRSIYGNQTGNHILDLQAINDIEISIPGSQGTGTILIENIQFY